MCTVGLVRRLMKSEWYAAWLESKVLREEFERECWLMDQSEKMVAWRTSCGSFTIAAYSVGGAGVYSFRGWEQFEWKGAV